MAKIDLNGKSLEAVNQLIDSDNIESYIGLCDDLIDKMLETGLEITLSDAEYRDFTSSLHNLSSLFKTIKSEDNENKQ